VTGITPYYANVLSTPTITVTGTNLGANDVVHVSLAGVEATAITWVSSTQIVVTSGVANVPASGTVNVTSLSFGSNTGASFAYRPVPLSTMRPPRLLRFCCSATCAMQMSLLTCCICSFP
jgi:hypothetical protein